MARMRLCNVYLAPKVLLATKLDLGSVSLTGDRSRYFERYDFARDAPHARQQYDHEFLCTRDGVWNSLACFVHVDMGIATRRFRSCQNYPFGDPRLVPSVVPSVVPSAVRGIDLSSHGGSDAYVGTWKNVVVILPTPVAVRCNQTLRLRTSVDARGLRPTYTFEIYVEGVVASVGDLPMYTRTQTIRLTSDDLHAEFLSI